MNKQPGIFHALFSLQEKKFPGIFGRFIFLRYGIFVIISAWIFQGVLYMSKLEAFLKLLWDIVFFLFFFWFGLPWYIALIFAHTLNFLLNGQCFAMLTHMGIFRVSPKNFLDRMEKTAEFLSHRKYVRMTLVFGSLVRGEYKISSDLDLRIVPESGVCASLMCALFAVYLRFIACLKGFPLDLYVFSLSELAKKMRQDEHPVLLCGSGGGLADVYPAFISFLEFKQHFYGKWQS